MWLFAACATCVALLVLPVDARAARLGERTLREGMRGSDVRALQQYLTRAGYSTTADGQFGPRTERSVMSFEGDDGRRVNGVVSRSDARALRAAAAEDAGDDALAEGSTEQATLGSDGLAIAPASAPPEVQAVIEAGNRIAKKPYKYGGGHARWNDTGYDCSGSMSYALRGGGLIRRPLDSTGFMRYGESGPGTWITTYANPGHAYMVVAGLRFDTSARKRTGTRWSDEPGPTRRYTVRHPSGF